MAASRPRKETTWTSAAAQAVGPGASSTVGSRRTGVASCAEKTYRLASPALTTSTPMISRSLILVLHARCFSACVLVILVATVVGLHVRGASQPAAVCSASQIPDWRDFLCEDNLPAGVSSTEGVYHNDIWVSHTCFPCAVLLSLRACTTSCNNCRIALPRYFSACGSLQCFSDGSPLEQLLGGTKRRPGRKKLAG